MRIIIFGPSGAGKSTLTKILARVLCHRLKVITGDDYIRRGSENWNALHDIIVGTQHFIFDHISSPTIISHCGIVPDLAIGLTGHRIEFSSLNGANAKDDINYSSKQVDVARAICKHTIEVASIQSALRHVLEFFREAGIFPERIESFVVKTASQCNLNCSYCYMYQALDDSFKSAPRGMPLNVAARLSRRLSEHFRAGGADQISIILHGGEPLLLPTSEFRSILAALGAELRDCNFRFSVQTNGTRLSCEYLDLLDEYGVQIGISVDGAGPIANRHREYHSKKPAYDEIVAGIDRCNSYRFTKGSFGGVLCVVDPTACGKTTYRQLRSLGVKSIDFLLRDETYTFAPGGLTTASSAGIYLTDAFDEWLADPEPCDVRLFTVIIALSLGAVYSTDSLGLYPYDAIGVGVAGEWELLDILRICWPGAWKTPYTVFDTSVSDIMCSAELARLHQWQYDFSDSCLGCKHLVVCGGGYLPHRYSGENGFRNPSTHCASLYALIEHVQDRLSQVNLATR